MTTTAHTQTLASPADCPSWCTSPPEDHTWGIRAVDGLPAQCHDGPAFGKHVYIAGEVDLFGRLDMEVNLDILPEQMTSERAREIGQHLIAAADRLDQITRGAL